MSDREKPTETEIKYAIGYALRSEGIAASMPDGCGGWVTSDHLDLSAEDLEPFTMRLLQALNII
ncbi:hypothetical protein [Pseudochrobactrum asaccharolyticum]|uniref:Uncharacterized protein n=1 Tax=Pseudochrobactrum asaccharolyticum TaxID=354351 RepID=A0A366DJ65_9HYPH|nr:hypothetical protein [Pseudochrobactrum asaccharolyticum]RBO89278.1 hypothetical protein DFR47_1166 [Pseudochrobactrum asaccharolyticum]